MREIWGRIRVREKEKGSTERERESWERRKLTDREKVSIWVREKEREK